MVERYSPTLEMRGNMLRIVRTTVITLSLVIAVFSIVSPVRAFPSVFPTGTTRYDPAKAFNTYVLFAPVGIKAKQHSSTVFLINMNGKVVHRWEVPLFAISARLLPNGHLLFVGQSEKMFPNRPGFGKFWIGGGAGLIMDLDWDGKVLSKYEDPYMHHDCVRLPNGHTLYLAWEPVPQALQKKIRGGMIDTEFPGHTMFNDYLVEIDGQGKVVWKWHANDHLDPDIDIIGPVYRREEWLHGNALAALPDGNILLTSRVTDDLLTIDRKSGQILSRWGSTSYLDKKTGRIEYHHGREILGGPHGGDVIAPDCPGAGHLICLDNGVYKFVSRAVEIDRTSNKLVWDSLPQIIARKPFSDFLGNAQRLPNGNTLICDGSNARFYQQTPQGELVWEYVSAYVPTYMMQGAVYKIHAYDPDFCPQLKTLPAAAGPAVEPPSNEKLQVPASGAGDDQSAQNPGDNSAGENAKADATPAYVRAVPFVIIAIVAAALALLLRKRQQN
jgi:hypothetical protein